MPCAIIPLGKPLQSKRYSGVRYQGSSYDLVFFSHPRSPGKGMHLTGLQRILSQDESLFGQKQSQLACDSCSELLLSRFLQLSTDTKCMYSLSDCVDFML